ncbi:helix-turn-helix domain-containing protein [Acetobacteraceae bacterium H6797]|nr:helix-turn-helix domain-containing protein [Acetobacteraceae bacterium H6797]
MSNQPQPVTFRAVNKTVIKASGASSAALAEDQKLGVGAGDIVTGGKSTREKDYWVVEGALLNGKPLPGHLKFLFRPHWQEVNEAPAVEPVVASATEPAAVKAPVEEKVEDASAKTSDDEKVAQIKALLAEGKSVSFIARTVRVGRSTVKRVQESAAG